MAFDRALALDSAYVPAYHLRGLCKHGMGDHRGAQADFMRASFYDGQVKIDGRKKWRPVDVLLTPELRSCGCRKLRGRCSSINTYGLKASGETWPGVARRVKMKLRAFASAMEGDLVENVSSGTVLYGISFHGGILLPILRAFPLMEADPPRPRALFPVLPV